MYFSFTLRLLSSIIVLFFVKSSSADEQIPSSFLRTYNNKSLKVDSIKDTIVQGHVDGVVLSSLSSGSSGSSTVPLKRHLNTNNIKGGQSIKCSSSEKGLYRYTNNQRRWYPNPEIAKSWDPNWGSPQIVDCTGIPEGPMMIFNVKEGDPIKCSGDLNNVAVYRFTKNQRRLYPDPDIAKSWDLDYDATKTVIDCTGIPKGSAMKFREGHPIKCSDLNNVAVYRFTQNQRRLYPNPSIASSWDTDYDATKIVIGCSGIPEGPKMTMFNLDIKDGQTIKCGEDEKTVYRYGKNKQLRLYPTPEIASSWDHPDYATTETVIEDCAVFPLGPNMTFKTK
jgi:hypothetical protein